MLSEDKERLVEELRKLLRQPSVSAQDIGVEECARLLQELMSNSGIETEVHQLPGGHPVVLGKVSSKTSRKTLLIYSHYDVQPPDPLEEWKHDPFSAELEDGVIYARGASDAKNNLMTTVKAAEYYLTRFGDVPVNLKFLFEGEEEIESPHLPEFIEGQKADLKADAVVCFDGEMDRSGRPAITLGVKGMLYVELRCGGLKSDLHSYFAPVVPNPVWRLVNALQTLRRPDGEIAIENWYRNVLPPTPEQTKMLMEIPFDEEELKERFGLPSFLNDLKGIEALKALIFNPTCTICGIKAGYSGPGLKTVLPREATAKVDFRLVPNQNAAELLKALRKHLIEKGFEDVKVRVIGSSDPSRTPADAEIAEVSMRAAEETYRMKPVVYPNSAVSAPDYLFTKVLGLYSVWTGSSPPYSNIHAPNEFTTVDSYLKGIAYAATIMEKFGKLPSST
jgi:acetylornithine deacetylase/succinyl-diaminopimelate desuccinylase-like protein